MVERIDLIQSFIDAQSNRATRIEQIRAGELTIRRGGIDAGLAHIDELQKEIDHYAVAIEYLRMGEPAPTATFQTQIKW